MLMITVLPEMRGLFVFYVFHQKYQTDEIRQCHQTVEYVGEYPHSFRIYYSSRAAQE